MSVILNEIADIVAIGIWYRALVYCAQSPKVNKNGLSSYCPGATPDEKLANLRAHQVLHYFRDYDHLANKANVGDSFAGGIVIYADPGVHGGGIVAHPTAIDTDVFGEIGVDHNAYGQSIGSGYSNTENIVANEPYVSAAEYPFYASLNGYNDWYMPSILELQAAYNANSHLGFSGYFWSSTETDLINNEYANYLDFDTGTIGDKLKSKSYKTMYCRTF